nr:ADP-ribosylation factor-like protein 9 isoform X2 [Oncorhynchus gorbuscha]
MVSPSGILYEQRGRWWLVRFKKMRCGRSLRPPPGHRGVPAYAVWSILDSRRQEEGGQRQVLVLGLDGAGKSSMLQGLTATDGDKRGHCRPTRGFNFMSLSAPARQLEFLEIGGAEDLRMYWAEYLGKTHALVLV